MNPVIKKYIDECEEADQAIEAWNEAMKNGEDMSGKEEPEYVNDREFIDRMKKQNASLRNLIDWAANCFAIGGDDGYLLDLVRYILES